MTKKKITNKEAIERLKGHISAIALYVTEARLDEEEVENELLNIEALEMAIEALQFQDIMVNNPKSAKPTPEVCKNCMDSKQDDWTLVSKENPLQTGEYLVTAVCDNGAIFTDKFGYTPTTDGGWYDPEVPDQTYVDWNKHIIAWMPMPKPYKGGDTE